MAKKPDLISLGLAYTLFCMLRFVVVANISQEHLQMLFCVSLEWEIAKKPFEERFAILFTSASGSKVKYYIFKTFWICCLHQHSTDGPQKSPKWQ